MAPEPETEGVPTRRKSVTISEAGSDSGVAESPASEWPPSESDAESPQSQAERQRQRQRQRQRRSSAWSPMVAAPPPRSALKKPEDVKYVIRSSDPIGQDTAVYEFNKYQMPASDSSATGLHAVELQMARLVAKVSVLLGRSSGRDKAAAVVQYGALFWGTQPFVNLTGLAPGPEAPWKKLEESMSNGRKVFRLGKWIKEYERARLALTAPDAYLGVVRGSAARLLAVTMNSCSFLYYFYDNMIWAANANLINRSPDEATLRHLLLGAYPKISYEQYVAMQSQHKEVLRLRSEADARVAKWKDFKNWSSLGRLLFAIVHSLLQKRALFKERKRLAVVYQARISAAARSAAGPRSGAETPPVGTVGKGKWGGESEGEGEGEGEGEDEGEEEEGVPSPKSLLRYDSAPEDQQEGRRKRPEEVKEERDVRQLEVKEAQHEMDMELLAASANLGILLSRLKFPVFKSFPLWVIGVLGIVSGGCGCLKNWPKHVGPPKQHKVAKRRSNSLSSEK